MRRHAALTLGALLLAGCAPWNTDLVRTGAVTIEHPPHDTVEIYWVTAHNDGATTRVHGQIRSRRHNGLPIYGHVDVALLAPSGELLGQAASDPVPVAPYRRGRAAPGQRFSVELPAPPPQGCTLRLAFHARAHDS